MSSTDRKAMCNICKVLTLRSNLRRHMRSKHGITSNSSKTAEPSEHDVNVVCRYCKKTFKRRKALLQHYRSVHANDPGVLSECAWIETYACHLCMYRTTRKAALRSHLSKTHENRPNPGTSNRMKCPMCEFESTRVSMVKHYQSAHDVRLVLENLKFDSEPLFHEWMSKIEEEDSCKFSRVDCYKCADSHTKIVYRCRRDGIYKTKGKNTRRPKSSSKINAVCPASLKVEIGSDGETSVTYCKTHFGHSQDGVKIRLLRAERDEIAKQISEGLSFDQIMDSFRIPLKRKDLHNIVRDYNLQKEPRSGQMASEESCIQDMLVSDNVIRFYKSPGDVLTRYPDLEAGSLILVVMNDAQVDMARRHGTNVVSACVIQAEISTLMISVLDDLGRGVPVAFLFSNAITPVIVDIFIVCFKEAIGFKIKPRILVTDVGDSFSFAWSKHMIEPHSRLYCGYCVELSWREYSESIENQEKRVDVRTALNLMKIEPSKATFSDKIKNALSDWNSSPDTKQFASYFVLYYSRWPSRWAQSCNESLAEVQPPFLSLHETINRIYLNAYAKGLDASVKALMKHVRKVLLEGLIHLSKNEASTRWHSIEARHDAAVIIPASQILYDGDTWKVPTRNGLKMYEVKSSKTDCPCQVRCDECNACIHSYTCSCPDSRFKFNLCKHIHAVCQHIMHTDPSKNGIAKDNYRFVDSAELSEQATSEGDETTINIEQEKKRLVKEFAAIVNRVNSIEHVKFIDKSLDLLKTLAADDRNFSY